MNRRSCDVYKFTTTMTFLLVIYCHNYKWIRLDSNRQREALIGVNDMPFAYNLT